MRKTSLYLNRYSVDRDITVSVRLLSQDRDVRVTCLVHLHRVCLEAHVLMRDETTDVNVFVIILQYARLSLSVTKRKYSKIKCVFLVISGIFEDVYFDLLYEE